MEHRTGRVGARCHRLTSGYSGLVGIEPPGHRGKIRQIAAEAPIRAAKSLDLPIITSERADQAMFRSDRVAALRRERAELIRFSRDLDDAQWRAPSKAAGWRVQDVVAHMGSGCHSFFTLASLQILRSSNIERTNDVFVDARRSWTPTQTLAEYERWSRVLTTAAGAISRTPLAALRVPLAELGKFPAGLLLAGAMTFDHHTHLRHDIAPALGLPTPDTDADRMTVVLEWMFAVLSNQLRASRPAWLKDPVGMTLRGPGGGSWVIDAGGAVAGGADASAAHIVGAAAEFPEWGTKRVDWRNRDVTINGDVDYATRFLDVVNVV